MIDAIIYLRKSREDLTKEDSLENHRKILVDLCNKNNWAYEIYEEVASASSLHNRTEFQKVLELIENRKVKRLVVIALDRLSRDKLDSAYIESLLIKYNVQVVTPTKIYNYDNEADLMLSDFESMLARQEYRMIRKRMLAGKEILAKQGFWITGEPPLGYIRNKDKILEIVPKEAELVKYIIQCYLSGNYSNNALARHLNELGHRGRRGALWDASRLQNLMHNKCYLGKVKYDNVWYDGLHEPLISKEDWNKVQEQLKGNRIITPRSSTKTKKKLQQLCKCGICNRTMTAIVDYNRNNKVFLKCHYKDKTSGQRCKNRSVQEEIIVQQLEIALLSHIQELQQALDNIDDNYHDEQIKAIQGQIEGIEKQIIKINNRIDNSKEMAKEGLITLAELKEEINKSTEAISDLEYKRKQLQSSIDNLNKDIKQELLYYKDVFNKIKEASSTEQYNSLVREVVNKITVKRVGNELDVDIKLI